MFTPASINTVSHKHVGYGYALYVAEMAHRGASVECNRVRH